MIEVSNHARQRVAFGSANAGDWSRHVATEHSDGGRCAIRRRSEGIQVFPIGLVRAARLHQWGEHGVDELGYAGHGAEVLGESGQACLFPPLDLVELADVGAAEAVDRLFGIADEEGATGHAFRDRVDDLRLQRIVVLEFVDQDAAEAAADRLRYLRIVCQQHPRANQQIVELQGALAATFFGVLTDELPEHVEYRRAEPKRDCRAKLVALQVEAAHRFPDFREHIAGPVLPASHSLDSKRSLGCMNQQPRQRPGSVGGILQPLVERDQPGEALVELVLLVTAMLPRCDGVAQAGDERRNVDVPRLQSRRTRLRSIPVLMQPPSNLAQVVQVDPGVERFQQLLRQCFVVQQCIQRFLPALGECEGGLGLVEDREAGR